MKMHLLLICMGYFFWGIGIMVLALGMKIGYSLFTTLAIFIPCLIFFAVIVFTSLQKVTSALDKLEKE